MRRPRYRAQASARDPVASGMSEKALQDTIVQAASYLGYLTYHVPDSRKCQGDTGFPDLVIAGHGALFFLENKAHGEKPTDAQVLWHQALGLVEEPPHVAVVCPQDLDRILHMLKAHARTA